MSEKNESSILFLCSRGDANSRKAADFIRRNFDRVRVRSGDWGDPFPEDLKGWEGDYVISYLSRWVVPETLIESARAAAINFHPAPPKYPGIGCTNFALYEEETEYGVTCHHMAPTVDTGRIIAVRRFPVYPSDDVESLLSRVHDYQLIFFYEIMGVVLNGSGLPESDETWTRKPLARTELNELAVITPDMPRAEVKRRIRATNFKAWRPTVEIGGFVFELKGTKKERSPLN